MKLVKSAALIAILGAGPALAADDGLYKDVFDPNSSFIRVLAPGESFASVDGNKLDGLPGGVSTYVNVMPGDVDVTLSDGSTKIAVDPSTHYTVVMAGDGAPQVVKDDITASPAKSDVTFYNLSGTDAVELYVPLAKAVAIGGVGPHSAKSVALKAPLTLDFEVRSGGQTLATIPQVELKRKAGVTIVLLEQDGAFTATATPNSYTN